MNEKSDLQLLAEFVHADSQEAFTTLVRRHLNLVHSVARRHSSDRQICDDITQAVFILLARKASSLATGIVLPGWLYTAATLTAANVQRSETRRLRREKEAFMQSPSDAEPEHDVWQELKPHLDRAMGELRGEDRDLLILRFFENKSLQQLGCELGIEERAAQKRVQRSIERLRRNLGRHGVTAGVGGLLEAISANAVQATPDSLALTRTISAAALRGSPVSESTQTLMKGVIRIMKWTKIKFAAGVSAVIVVAVGLVVAVLHHHGPGMGASGPEAHALKVRAERAAGAAGPATLAPPSPDGNKAEAERRAGLQAVRRDGN